MIVHIEWMLEPVPEWGSEEMIDIQERVGFAIVGTTLVAKEQEDEWPPDEYVREMIVRIEAKDPDDLIHEADPDHELFGFDVSEREKRFTVYTHGPNYFGDSGCDVLRKNGVPFFSM